MSATSCGENRRCYDSANQMANIRSDVQPLYPSMPKVQASSRPGVGLFLMKPCLPEPSSWRNVVFLPVFGFPERAKRTECEPAPAASPWIVNVHYRRRLLSGTQRLCAVFGSRVKWTSNVMSVP